MSLQIWFQVAAFGAVLIALGIASFIIQLVVSYIRRESLRDLTGDPWDGRTLEWSTSSPPPAYNFAFTPRIHDNDAWSDMKARGYERPLEGFSPIHMPKNTAAGFIIAALSAALGFGMIWHMWLLAGVSFVAMLVAIIVHTFNYKRDYHIPRTKSSAPKTRVRACWLPMSNSTALPSASHTNTVGNAASVPTFELFNVRNEDHHPENGTLLGFWLYLMSDCLIFAVPVRGVRRARAAATRPGPRAPTCSTCRWWRSTRRCCCCRPSPTASRCCEMQQRRQGGVLMWLAITGLLGAGFIGLELYEFAHLLHEGAGPQRSAFLSSFFALVGTHGLHVSFGIVWLITLMVQVPKHGFTAANRRRLMCLSMFWHFLDVVWIGVFTFVYLMGVAAMSAQPNPPATAPMAMTITGPR
jgi:cytochrome o ubiquinol oxidase subunit 3